MIGPPELVVEVADSSRAYDLGPKKRDYERHGVPEYLFLGINPPEVRWFVLQESHYDEIQPDPHSILKSAIFPGLWLDPAALLARDSRRLMAVLHQGLASPKHAAFVER